MLIPARANNIPATTNAMPSLFEWFRIFPDLSFTRQVAISVGDSSFWVISSGLARVIRAIRTIAMIIIAVAIISRRPILMLYPRVNLNNLIITDAVFIRIERNDRRCQIPPLPLFFIFFAIFLKWMLCPFIYDVLYLKPFVLLE